MKPINLIFCVIFSVAVFACKKDNSEQPKTEQQQQPVKEAKCYINTGIVANTTARTYKFNYDADTNLLSIKVLGTNYAEAYKLLFNTDSTRPYKIEKQTYYGGWINLNYNTDGKITNYEDYDIEDDDEPITKISTTYLNYSDGHVVNTVAEYKYDRQVKTNYEYDNKGNVLRAVSINQFSGASKDTFLIQEYIYDDKHNPYYHLPLFPIIDFAIINSPNNVVSSTTKSFFGNPYLLVNSYDYTYSSNSLPESVGLTNTFNGQTSKKMYTYLYNCK